jgi:hypothetical protein
MFWINCDEKLIVSVVREHFAIQSKQSRCAMFFLHENYKIIIHDFCAFAKNASRNRQNEFSIVVGWISRQC